MVEVNQDFLRSVKGGIKISRMVLALIATICFGVVNTLEVLMTLTIIELVINVLFFLLYLLDLQKVLTFLFWPLVDALNSVVAALFLFTVGLYATVKRIVPETLAAGVICLLLSVLCVVDAALLLRKITLNKDATRTRTGFWR